MTDYRSRTAAALNKPVCEASFRWYSREICALVVGSLIVAVWSMGGLPSQGYGSSVYNMEIAILVFTCIMLAIVVIDVLVGLYNKMKR